MDVAAVADLLGLADDGVDYVANEENADLLTEPMRATIEEAKQKIISGEIEVHDYESDSACPV